MHRLKEKIALVTGAASGIGKAIAELFAQEGATVIVTDINDEQGKTIAQQIGGKTSYHHLNVANEQEWQTVINDIINTYNNLDILINNAGVIGLESEFGPQDPEHASLKSWRKIHEINLDSVFLGCKYGIKAMKNSGGGSIVNMSSRSGLVGVPSTAAYASSKAAIRNHTKSVALYCAQQNYNIRCNSVHPAAILTPIWDPVFGQQQNKEREKRMLEFAKAIPLQRLGTPEEVASLVLYLASDESKFTTGAEFVIDGGILAGSSAAPQAK